jgi:hypothetical protein
MAHELTHVVQQANSGGHPLSSSLQIGTTSDPHEREAERSERAAPHGHPSFVAPMSSFSPVLRRQKTQAPAPSCALKICWVPIKAYGLGNVAQVHGVFNLKSGAATHHIEVDPSQHMPVGIWHSHVIDSPGAKVGGDCQTLSATCGELGKIETAAKEYESKDVIYDPLTVTGPNSNSFIEWILARAGLNPALVSVPFGATGWGYFESNPPQRTDPPHVARTDANTTPAPPAKSAAGGTCTTTFTKQTSAGGYLDLIRAAESRMTAAGIPDVKDQIKILRGLYYGTPWSRDFGKEQSLSRVAGFQAFTLSGVKYPRDPVSILDCGLYGALQRSQDVSAHGVPLDVGHLLIGLDAREATVAGVSVPSFSFPGFGGSGLDIVTWLGDLGGGAASLARDRVLRSPTQPASTKFVGGDYGGSSNLEGDVAAFIVGRGGAMSVVAPVVPPGKGIADLLAAYMSPTTLGGTADWKSRATTFLTMCGGTFSASGALSNEPSMIEAFADQIESFACEYMRQRYLGTLSEADLLATADNVRPCSREVGQTFVHALEDAITTGGRIAAKRFPTPSPAEPGACPSVTLPLRAKQKAKQLLQQGKQLWKGLFGPPGGD